MFDSLKKILKVFLTITLVFTIITLGNVVLAIGSAVLAGVPAGGIIRLIVWPPYLQHVIGVPIMGVPVELGAGSFMGWGPPEYEKELLEFYKEQREATLEFIARTQPQRQIRALVVLDDFFSYKDMNSIIDPSQFNVFAFWAGVPKSLVMGTPYEEANFQNDTLAAGYIFLPVGKIPAGTRYIENWLEFTKVDPLEDRIWSFQDMLQRDEEALKILKAGNIPEGWDVYMPEEIKKLSPEERKKTEYYNTELLPRLISSTEDAVSYCKLKIEGTRKFYPNGIFAVAIEGNAKDINKLRDRPEVLLVDPLLFRGIMSIQTIANQLKVDLVPYRPSR